MKIWNLWKKKWNIESDRRMIWIFVVFAITGTSTMFVRKYLFSVLGIEIENAVLAFVVKLVAILVIYQLLLFLVGTIMGEGKFVRWFLNKSMGRFLPKSKK